MLPNSKKVILYHGTSNVGAYSIVSNGLQWSRLNPKTDFSEGFYLTTNLDQAWIWADKAEKAASGQRNNMKMGSVVVFELNSHLLKSLVIIDFKEKDNEWAEFISRCRNGSTHEADVVMGPLADGDGILGLSRQHKNKKISTDEYRKKIDRYEFPLKNQISFHSEKGFVCLRIVKIL